MLMGPMVTATFWRADLVVVRVYHSAMLVGGGLCIHPGANSVCSIIIDVEHLHSVPTLAE